MKKLLLLLISLLISFNSYGGLTYFGDNADGDTFYIDIETIKEHGGYVYWWRMIDLVKPTKDGTMSYRMYKQGDCGVNRYKVLSFNLYNQPMGRGNMEKITPPSEWNYPIPESVSGVELTLICRCEKWNICRII